MKVTSIRIRPEWFYHSITSENFNKIIQSGEIRSKKFIDPSEKVTFSSKNTSNGFYYISLSRKENVSVYDSSYAYFIKRKFALILDEIPAKKAHYISDINFYEMSHALRTFNFPIRFSTWKDEYQVKGSIPLACFVGIKIPSNNKTYTSWEQHIQEVDHIIQVMEENQIYFPFIDVEFQKQIDVFEIRQYIKNR